MADWYVSSAKFATVAAWQATRAYVAGDLIKATAPAIGREYVFRCTTAGTSGGTEPTWSTAYANNATRTDGSVTWTNVSAQSAYGWNAAAGSLLCIGSNQSNRPAVGDRVFIASDHSETFSLTAPGGSWGFVGSSAFGSIQVISVNRAGSVPPVAADIQPGAALTNTVNVAMDGWCNMYWQGLTITCSGTSIFFNNATAFKSHTFKDCALRLTGAAALGRIQVGNTTNLTWDNTTVQYSHTAQGINSVLGFELNWVNTPGAIIGATIPVSLFPGTNSANGWNNVTCRGVDLSAQTGTLVSAYTSSGARFLFDSCRIAAGATRYGAPPSSNNAHDLVELVNCFDGTNVVNERYSPAGVVTTDRSTTMAGGAQDDIGNFSLKLVSSVRSDFAVMPLDCFWLDVGNIATGSSKTATVEIISSGSLNNTDIKLQLEYMGTAGSSLGSFTESLASVLTPAAALPASSASWNSPPATPQKQYLQVTFTPQVAGRVRGLVRLGKASTTVWVNPKITIT